MTSLAPLLQAFFTDRLMTQRRASPHTISAYRDTLRLLLDYVTTQTGTAPSALQISDLDAPCVTGFLTHLQQVRGNSVRTRNARLAAIHSLFAYAALRHPEHAAVIQRVLAIPSARLQRNVVSYLDRAEADALLAACDPTTRTGRRDHAMFALAIQTGLRISELTGLTVADGAEPARLRRAGRVRSDAQDDSDQQRHHPSVPGVEGAPDPGVGRAAGGTGSGGELDP